jgi:hypothetical protein
MIGVAKSLVLLHQGDAALALPIFQGAWLDKAKMGRSGKFGGETDV